MRSLYLISTILLLFLSNSLHAQNSDSIIANDTLKSQTIDPLRPSKAAFYSAIVPGLGQAYNKDYWKIPIVYGGIGLSMYSYSTNNTKYRNYRAAYKRRLAGFNDDKFDFLDDRRLISAQRFHQRNRDLSLLIAVGVYVLNIVEANVAAHLKQFNVDGDLSVTPTLYHDEQTYKPQVGLAINYRFQ